MLVLVVLLICCANLSGLFLARAAALLPLYRRMIARMNSMPGIVSASVAEIPPLFEVGDGGRFVAADAGPKAQAVGTFANAVGRGFFQGSRTSFVTGRDLRNTRQTQTHAF
jgi:hypothetical protein